MAHYQAERVLEVKATLGEGPAWSVKHQALFWVDIEKHTLNRFTPASGENRVWKFPAAPGCFVFSDDDNAVVAARDGFYTINFDSGEIKRICAAPFDPKENRFNDGKTDRQGRFFWVGSFYTDYFKTLIEGRGVVYRFDGKTAVPCITQTTAANGTAFSPDGKTMYRAESLTRVIYAHDYDPDTGAISRERIFTKIPEEYGFPDGATIDTQGGYWVALPMGPKGGGVGRFAPDGKLDIHIEVPVMVPTMVCFGGPTMSTLYITSSNEPHFTPRPLGPNAGDLFAMETPFQGIEETMFRMPK